MVVRAEWCGARTAVHAARKSRGVFSHDSPPTLRTDSQLSINNVDSQGVVTTEPGPGALRGLQTKKRAALIADVHAAVAAARADEASAAASVAVALATQAVNKKSTASNDERLRNAGALGRRHFFGGEWRPRRHPHYNRQSTLKKLFSLPLHSKTVPM